MFLLRVPDHGWFLQICLSVITPAGLERERVCLIMVGSCKSVGERERERWANCDNEASMFDYVFLFIF